MACRVVIDVDGGDAGLLASARRRIEELEDRWSRFLPGSDISSLNLAQGTPVAVHEDTRLLVEFMRAAHKKTAGLFNPTLIPALVSLGDPRTGVLPSSPIRAFDTLDDIAVDGQFVTLPEGMVLDPASLAKGLAADIVTAMLVEEGCRGACVSVGGDLRFTGPARPIPVLAPTDEVLAHVGVSDGALATSYSLLREFEGNSHVLDPSTLAPIQHDIVQTTVAASSAAWAEAIATAVLVAGSSAPADALGLGAMLVSSSGVVSRNAFWQEL